jgi:hypothetical protein
MEETPSKRREHSVKMYFSLYSIKNINERDRVSECVCVSVCVCVNVELSDQIQEGFSFFPVKMPAWIL